MISHEELRDDLIDFQILEAMAENILCDMEAVTEEITKEVYALPIEEVILNLEALDERG